MTSEDIKKTHDACHVQMYGQVTVGSKGQVVIPNEIRKKLHIEPGDTLIAVTKHDKAIGFVKTDDMADLMAYLQKEMDNK